jgi:hypothetical protein
MISDIAPTDEHDIEKAVGLCEADGALLTKLTLRKLIIT